MVSRISYPTGWKYRTNLATWLRLVKAMDLHIFLDLNHISYPWENPKNIIIIAIKRICHERICKVKLHWKLSSGRILNDSINTWQMEIACLQTVTNTRLQCVFYGGITPYLVCGNNSESVYWNSLPDVSLVVYTTTGASVRLDNLPTVSLRTSYCVIRPLAFRGAVHLQ